MTKPSSMDERVTELEEQLPQVADKAEAAIFLARKADEDVSEFSAKLDKHKDALQALRETQVEQGKDLKELRKEMRNGFSTIHVGMAQITALLTVAEERSDES